jgi:hypothetical protein
MCGKSNDADLEVCRYCGARLKPLVIRPFAGGAEGTPTEPPSVPPSADRSEESGQIPEWLARIRAHAGGEEPSKEEEPEKPPEEGQWLDRLRQEEQAAAEAEEDDALRRLKVHGRAPQDVVGEPPEEAPPEPPEEAPPEEPGDWLSKLREVEQPAESGAGEEELPPWIDSLAVPGTEEELPREPAEEEELPLEKGEVPPWLEDLPAPQPEEPAPHTAPLVFGPSEEEEEEITLEKIDLPEWAADLKPPSPAEETPDLAPASLPAWLESLRPIEAPPASEAGEEAEAVEMAGPLAGLMGVLSAEPAVAMPRTPTVGGGMLQISEKQYAQADILRQLLDEEGRERQIARHEKRRLPFLRWAVTLLLLAAVAIPATLGIPSFAAPTRVTRDLVGFVELVERVPSSKTALLVVDYEPAYSGELEAVAAPFVEHLARRGIAVATLSTRISGAPLAERLLASTAAAYQWKAASNYVHMGYLAGGPSAVQLFAAAPRQAILAGFLLPANFAPKTVWETPVLQDVQALSDFGIVAVITSGTETARIWAEQALAWKGNTPLVMVLTAGADPLVRPYYEASHPGVDGILSGIPAAVVYEEQVIGSRAVAFSRWNGFGMGALVTEILLGVGIVMGIIPGLRRILATRARNA